MEAISTFDIFKIGVGPSSSHTMGPWRAAQRFLTSCEQRGMLPAIRALHVNLYGSLAKTGKGHGTDMAVILGLAGEDPTRCDPDAMHRKVAAIRDTHRLPLCGGEPLAFDPASDICFRPDITLPFHPNALTFQAVLGNGEATETYYSIGGGFVIREGQSADEIEHVQVPYPADTAAELLRHCGASGLSIAELSRANERSWRADEAIRADLRTIWDVMRESVFRGCRTDGMLPGPLRVVRRAAQMSARRVPAVAFPTSDEWARAIGRRQPGFRETMEWVTCFALAVNEENASYGRVVTAPTNGAAGVIPAVLMYMTCFQGGDMRVVEEFLLTAAAVGSLFKKGATISAAMGGCQAEIGVSSAMAAAGLCAVLGGTPEQSLMAAEIAMEHHLGLTCDPVGGFVQIPCIERNTMGAIKAIASCFLALESDPHQAKVPLDAVIQSMWATALDMNTRYKETSEGGLALHIPVSLSDC